MMNAIEFDQVQKYYGDFHALKGISFNIPQGSFFALLGPNGAGKSTLINSLAGLVTPTSGHIRLMGQDIQRYPQLARRNLGLVPQELVSEPFFSVVQLLKYQAGYFGLRQVDSWIEQLLVRLDLWNQRDQLTHTLSGGMKRRLLIAMALVHKPAVVVLDEPTAGVDVDLRRNLWSFAQELHQAGHTLVLTTHYLEEAEQLCDQVAIVHQGRLLALESKKDLLNRDQHRWVYIQLQKGQELTFPSHQAWWFKAENEGYLLQLPKQESLHGVIFQLMEQGLVIEHLDIRQPSLEEVFVEMVKMQNTTGSQSSEL